MYLLAQATGGFTPEGQGFDLVNTSIELAQQTVEAWDDTWKIMISPDSQLWQSLARLGLLLALITILWLVMTEGKDAIERHSYYDLVKMTFVPLIVAMFLTHSATPLATVVLGIRGYGHAQVQSVLKFQVGENGMGDSITKIAVGSSAMTQVESLFAECSGKVNAELDQCLKQQQQQAQAVLQSAEQKAGPLPDVQRKIASYVPPQGAQPGGNGLTDAVGDAFKTIAFFIIKGILWALQWGFVNLLEVALLLTAALSPVALGLSLLPIQGRPIIAWLIGFMSLFGMQLSYNVVTGLVATVMIKSQSSVAGDIAFLFFLAILSPLLCTIMCSMSGLAIFNAIANSTSSIARDVASSVYSAGGWGTGRVAGQFNPVEGSGMSGAISGQAALPSVKGELGV